MCEHNVWREGGEYHEDEAEDVARGEEAPGAGEGKGGRGRLHGDGDGVVSEPVMEPAHGADD